ncbi:DUF6527 family protein [Aurantimonas sp. 22II-16-19i]|uniref:DUF6527 family protein n=1 Tax=Aurantimonas sp. 22II-16-19i TaxID=1317114 RepID=UPI0009F7C77E|nr:DUF6527 family protein [Aurantimonas sp. 22II-16-19i]ORE91017.1 hypothetical protein ATO4_20184 [Aurantimonas sp. 22II-16-19i]
MMAARGVLRTGEDGALFFHCPGCTSRHMIMVGAGAGPRWSFNGDFDRPTFDPSVNVTYPGPDAGIGGAPPTVCHSFVRDGEIQFLGDCTHALSGQTVPLKPIGENP